MERFILYSSSQKPVIVFVMVWLLLLVAIVVNGQSVGYDTYIVKGGDNPYRIAVAHGMKVDELYKLNPEIKTTPLSVGQVLKLKKSSSPSANNESNTSLTSNPSPTNSIQKQKPNSTSKQETYTVKAGDTYYSLSKKFNTSVEELRTLNGDVPKVNSVLVLPSSSTLAKNTSNTTNTEHYNSNLLSKEEVREEVANKAKAEEAPKIVRKSATMNSSGEILEKEQAVLTTVIPQKTKKSGGFDAKELEEEQENEKNQPIEKIKSVDPDSETTQWDSEFSLTQNRVVTQTGYANDGTKRILLIPFDPLLYISDADEEIANLHKIKRDQVRNYFRRRLNVLIEPNGYETIRLMGAGAGKDSLRDLDRMYAGLEYNYQEILDDPESYEKNKKDVLGHQVFNGKTLNDMVAKTKMKLGTNPTPNVKRDDYSNSFFGVKVKDKEFVEYFNQKYNPEYYVFVSQFEVKTHYNNTQERAANIFTREFIAHYTIINREGNFVKGNRVSIPYDSNTKNVKQMVDDNMDSIAKKIMNAIPSPGYSADRDL